MKYCREYGRCAKNNRKQGIQPGSLERKIPDKRTASLNQNYFDKIMQVLSNKSLGDFLKEKTSQSNPREIFSDITRIIFQYYKN